MTSHGIQDAYEALKRAQCSLNALLDEQFAADIDPELAEALAHITRAQDRLLAVRERAASRSLQPVVR